MDLMLMSILKNTVLPIHYPISLTRINYFMKSKRVPAHYLCPWIYVQNVAQSKHD